MHISAIGVAVCAIFDIALSIIAGKSILRSDATSPVRIPIIIGFVIILYKAFLMLSPLTISADSSPFSGAALNVRATTDIILKSGTAAAIIRGAIPVSEYIFWINAIPRIAALLLQEPWIKAPLMVLSFMKISVRIHTTENINSVTITQYRTNLISNFE